MFDFAVQLDRTAYAEGDPVTLTADAGSLAIRFDEVKYSLHERITDADHPQVGEHVGDPIAFVIDGASATGSALSGHGMLFVRALDGAGRDAATYVPVPVVDGGRIVGP